MKHAIAMSREPAQLSRCNGWQFVVMSSSVCQASRLANAAHFVLYPMWGGASHKELGENGQH